MTLEELSNQDLLKLYRNQILEDNDLDFEFDILEEIISRMV